MNLSDIANTEKDQKFFWGTCGVAGLITVIVVIIYAFSAAVWQTLSSSDDEDD